MAKYSPDFKSTLVQKVLSSPDRSISSVAKEANLNLSTLHKWVQELKHGIIVPENNSQKRLNDWTMEERFKLLIESAPLDEAELGVFCRKKGLFIHQLKTWKSEFMANTDSKTTDKKQAEIRALRLKNKALEKDLRRKEKALAETTALLVLKKKADLIWGASEAD